MMASSSARLPQLAAMQASLAAIREHHDTEDLVDQIVHLRQSVDTLAEVVDGIVAHLQSGLSRKADS